MNKYKMDRTLVLGLGSALILAGCATPHYKVTDPQSGMTYFTEEIDHMNGGSVKLKDARSGSTVTLQNSEVKEISSEDFKAGVTAPAPAAPAPAATAPAAPAPAATAPAAPAPATQAAPTSAPSTKP